MISHHLPSGRRQRFLVLAGIVVALGSLILYLTVALDRKREVDDLLAVRDSLSTLRAAVDSCKSDLAREESAFRRFDAEVDSLRLQVDDYEGLDPEGVPAAEYEAYLETFDHYNEAVADWEGRADSLRVRETVCRTLVERHNQLADSLRVRIAELDSADSD